MSTTLRGREYSCERRFFHDATTGARITQLTDFPVPNQKFYFHINHFTPDSQTLLFRSSRGLRSSMIDVFRVDVDGRNMLQLTDSDTVSSPILSYSGKYLYYSSCGTLMRVDINTFEEEEIFHLDGLAKADGCASLTLDDRWIYFESVLKDGRFAVLRYATDGSEGGVIFTHGEQITHTQVEPTQGKTVAIQTHTDAYPDHNLYLMDADGGNFRLLDLPHGNGHWMWVGDTQRIMTNLSSRRWGIQLYGEGDDAPRTIAKDLHYWHASCSMDGKWMISDTNWPDDGLRIINVATGRVELLCRPQSTCSHPSWTHPHPSFSPDMRCAVYNSNVTGIGHVYLAEIDPALLARMAEAY